MSIQIGGRGNKYVLEVNQEGQALVKSESLALQHWVALNKNQSYQVVGDFASVNNSTHTILHVKNTDADRVMAISYVRVQLVGTSGGTALPAAATRFELGYGRTYASGGTAVTPVNTTSGAANSAAVTAYDNNPTMAGTFTELDRIYVDNSQYAFNKEGSLLIPQNQTFEIRVVSDHTAGTAYARITFMMLEV